jgi:hypothetical protein
LHAIHDEPIKSNLSTLQTELERYANTIVDAETATAVDEVDARGVRDALDTVENSLQTVGLTFDTDRRDVEAALSNLRRAREAFLNMNEEESTLDNIKPWKSSTEEQQEEALKDYRMQKNKLEDTSIFSLGPPSGSFQSTVEYGIDDTLDAVQDHKVTLREEITEEFERIVESPASPDRDAFESELHDEARHSELADIVSDALEKQLEGTADVQERIAELESELEEVTDQIQQFESTTELFEELNRSRDKQIKKEQEVNQKRSEHEAGTTTNSVSTQSENYVYVKNIQPEDVFRATGDDDIKESDLFKSQAENRRLQSNLEELAKNARDQQYTGLTRRKFSSSGERYGDLKVRVAALSPAVDEIDNEALDFEDTFSGAFDLGASGRRIESPYTTWQRDVGGPWDIGLSVFIDGVFLDNIRKVVQADGYFDGYRQRMEGLGDDILIHHSYGLESGFYVRRNDLLNVESDEDVELLLDSESDVVDRIYEEYADVIPLEGDDVPEAAKPTNSQPIQEEQSTANQSTSETSDDDMQVIDIEDREPLSQN